MVLLCMFVFLATFFMGIIYEYSEKIEGNKVKSYTSHEDYSISKQDISLNDPN